MDMIEIKNERLTAVFSTHGAELQSLRDQNGVERIWQGDPAFWTGHAPVLFPVAGALRGDAYTLDGVRYAMPKHGFSSGMDWQVEKQTADSRKLSAAAVLTAFLSNINCVRGMCYVKTRYR